MAARKTHPPVGQRRASPKSVDQAPTREELNAFLDSLLVRGETLKREMEELSERIARPLATR